MPSRHERDSNAYPAPVDNGTTAKRTASEAPSLIQQRTRHLLEYPELGFSFVG